MKKKSKKPQIKFPYTLEFQWDIIKAICQDTKNGESILKLIKSEYFEDLQHTIIIEGLLKFYKRYHRIPGSTFLKESIISLLKTREYINLISQEEQNEVLKMVDDAYHEVLKDSDLILEKSVQFHNYCNLKPVIENANVSDFSTYETLSKSIQKAIENPLEVEEVKASFLIEDIRARQLRRQSKPHIFPTPFRQLNDLTNAGGFSKNSIIVILDKPKRSKTATLLNIARGYMRMRKKVLYIDLENGQDELLIREEQSMVKKTKQEILSGEHDDQVAKVLRRYKRLGAEMVIERKASLVTNCNHLSAYLDTLKRDYNFVPNVLIIDMAAKLAANSGVENDTERIFQVYVELGNLAQKHNIEHIWSPHHVTREAEKKSEKRYDANDIAKCIDIVREVQTIYGLNSTEEERRQGVLRMEIVEQRDGVPNGRALFHFDQPTQYMEEFTKAQRKEYDAQFAQLHGTEEGETIQKRKSTSDL